MLGILLHKLVHIILCNVNYDCTEAACDGFLLFEADVGEAAALVFGEIHNSAYLRDQLFF
jgi:hypothetical protein